VFSSPFADVPEDIVTQAVVEAGKSAKERFENSLEKLLEAIRSFDVLHILSLLAAHGLTTGLTKEGKPTKRESDLSILQAHVEFVQALAIQLRPDQQSFQPIPPQEMQEIWDLLIENGQAFQMERLSQIGKTGTSQDKAVIRLQERLRNNTQFIRNWGFLKRVIRITRVLYSPLDKLYERITGRSANDIISVFEILVAQIEQRLNHRIQQLGPILGSKTVEDCVVAYYQIFPEMEGTPDDLIKLFREREASREEVLGLIVSHADIR
jgi:hypothetical protein